jgi:hypothetical protein
LPIFLFVLLLFQFGCSEEIVVPETETGVTLLLAPLRAATDDADNLPAEYNILNLSIFLTDAGSNTITDKFVNQPFSAATDVSIMNCKLVNLPTELSAQPAKDVYVIANFDNVAAMNAVQTVDDLKALQTPTLVTPNILTTGRGLPMFGETDAVDFSTATTDNPPSVMLIRTCAKIRVTLTFPDATWVGTENMFVIENAPAYTYFVPNSFALPSTAFFDYPRIMFSQNSPQEFVSTTYIYESSTPPRLHLYTTVNGVAKDYLANSNFPLPVRNYLYDIQIQILKPLPTTSTAK